MTQQKAQDIRYSSNIDQATLWQFKKVVASGDVRFLLILNSYDELPEYDTDELTTVWYGLYADFSEIIGGNRADLWLVKQKRLITMKVEYQMGAVLLSAVQAYPSEETVAAAKLFGYFIDLDNLKPTFEKAHTKLKRLEGKILTIENESKQENKEDEGQDLEGLIATLEKHQGYQFDEQKMSVRKFAHIYKNFKDAREQTK